METRDVRFPITQYTEQEESLFGGVVASWIVQIGLIGGPTQCFDNRRFEDWGSGGTGEESSK